MPSNIISNPQPEKPFACSETFDNSANDMSFPSYAKEYAPPEWYCREREKALRKADFPVFRLPQDYASISEDFSETCTAEDCSWLKFDFKTKPHQYMQEVLKYIYRGNLENDWTDPQGWFGAPYMHLDTVAAAPNGDKFFEPVGREFMRGLTMERVTCDDEINGKTTKPQCSYPDIYNLPPNYHYNWAISYYDARGGKYIGKVWQEIIKEKPNLEKLKEGFPEGTVSVKFLFTQASVKVAPYLENSVEWQTDTLRRIKKDGEYTAEKCLENNLPSEKCFPKLRLLQIDIAVKDKRAVQTGWVFGTFIYNKNAKEFIEYESDKEINRAWLKLEPVGLMFGNDPKAMLNKAETEEDDGRIIESVINQFITVKQHLGCAGRLSGPVDNPKSSCLSCHALAETPDNLNPESVPYAKMACKENADIERLFQNIKPPATFTPSDNLRKIYTLDYSLQLREGIFRFWLEKNKCYAGAENLKNCFGEKTNSAGTIPKHETIKNLLNREGTQAVK